MLSATASVEVETGLVGLTLEGRYRVGRRLGRGACGVVHEATSLTSAVRSHGKRKVAIKILAAHHAGDPGAIARFTHEAYVSAKVVHPRLVRVLDFGWAAPGRPYFAMELCRGATLDRVLNEAGRLPATVALPLLEDAAEALTVLHSHGIVHRDIKPANLYVTTGRGRPRARVLDLGVSGVFDARKARRLGAVHTGGRGTYGTPAYLAPEQALGAHTDDRTDVYALACVAYRMLTGHEPFSADTVFAMVQAHLYNEARPASSLNPALLAAVDAVLARGMSKEPSLRQPSAARFVAELRAALA